jgi:hypothetical protein
MYRPIDCQVVFSPTSINPHLLERIRSSGTEVSVVSKATSITANSLSMLPGGQWQTPEKLNFN